MEVILIWLLTNLLTWLAWKLKWSKTYISVAAAIVAGTIYYLATNYYSAQWQEVVTFIAGVYASSQLIFNILKKMWYLDSNKKDGEL